MDHETLRRFNGDPRAKEAVLAYVSEFVGSEALRLLYDRKDVSHIADAKALIEGAFERLSNDYAAPAQKIEATNQAK